jgi:glycosyltransferase involved in cell wall biosynthesis
MARPLRVLYVFTARKQGLLARVTRGEAPDTLLFGFNHLRGTDVEPEFYEPEYAPAGRFLARQVGRLGPDVLQLRTLPRFTSYDVVLLTGCWPLLLAAQAIPRRRRPKLVWLNLTLTNLLRRRHPTSGLLGLAVELADRIVCVARFQQAFLSQRLGWHQERLPLVLSGTDASFFRPQPETAPPSTRYVLAAGRDAGRDYATLLQAMPPGHELHLVCSRLNLAGMQLPPQVRVRYDIPPTELRAEYAGAAAVAVPTYDDRATAGSDCSGTLVLLDALAMGRPAVISERRAVHDYVRAGEHAVVVPAEQPDSLRDALRRLLDDPDGAQRLAAAGRQRVLDTLTTRHFATRLAQVLREVAGA